MTPRSACRPATVAALLMSLAACATGTEAARTEPLLAPDLRLALPRPSDFGRSLQVAQRLTVRHAGRTLAFDVHISVTPEQVLLVGLDAAGRRAMTVTWRDDGIAAVVAPWLPEVIRPGSMIADIVVLFWPESAVRQALAGTDAALVADVAGRTVAVPGRTILRTDILDRGIGAWPRRMRYRNLAWGYEIEIESVSDGG